MLKLSLYKDKRIEPTKRKDLRYQILIRLI